MLDLGALRQAEAEFYLYGQQSQFPFTQLVTDLRTGGVAYYCRGEQGGERIVEGRVLVGMQDFWAFLKLCIGAIPPNTGQDTGEHGQIMVLPAELHEPKRMKLLAPCRNAVGGGAWAALCTLLDNDVANLEDLGGFGVGCDNDDREEQHCYSSSPSYFS